MPDIIRRVHYFYVVVPDVAGEGFLILSDLRQAGVNLLGCHGFPLGEGKSQISMVPEDAGTFVLAAARLGLHVSQHRRAFLAQGEDRVGAVTDVIEKLAGKGINIVACHAVGAGEGRWGMLLWVNPVDYERAAEALGAAAEPATSIPSAP